MKMIHSRSIKIKITSLCFCFLFRGDFCNKHINIWSFTKQWFIFLQHEWPERESNSTWQRCCDALLGRAHTLHALLNFWPFLTLNNYMRREFSFKVESCFAFVSGCFVAPGLTGLYIWLAVICFVSWWWGPVIDGRDPGHLRSTAVDSSEIESSSRSVTMSSLRSWLGRQPSKPHH